MKALRTAWHGVAMLAFLFAAVVAVSLAGGRLDPMGSPYYGVVVSEREPLLYLSLAVLQVVALGDAVALAWRRRQWRWWAAVILAALTLPFLLVVAIAQLDLWRYGRRAGWANAAAGLLSLALLVLALWLRGWAWTASSLSRPVARPGAAAP